MTFDFGLKSTSAPTVSPPRSERLTAKERARLVLRAWCNGDQHDERIVRHMPDEQREEYDRILQVVDKATAYWHEDCAFWAEWVNLTDHQLAFLEWLAVAEDRTNQLVAALRREGVQVGEAGQRARKLRWAKEKCSIRPLPEPARGFRRDVLMLWGQDNSRPPPSSAKNARAWLAEEVKADILIRWKELAAVEDRRPR